MLDLQFLLLPLRFSIGFRVSNHGIAAAQCMSCKEYTLGGPPPPQHAIVI